MDAKKMVEHYDCGGRVYVQESPRMKGRLARPGEDLDALVEAGGIVRREPVNDPPILIHRHEEGAECFICDGRAA